MSKFAGVNIREVWDFRLSSAVPHIDRRGGTWVVHICAKSNPDHDPKNPKSLAVPLESFDTEIPTEKDDSRDEKKLVPCYEWLLSVRDKYALPNIEEMKPIVATIRAHEAKLAELQKGKTVKQIFNDVDKSLAATAKAGA